MQCFIGLMGSKYNYYKYYKRPVGVVYKKSHTDLSFLRGSSVKREWVVAEGRLYEYFREQGPLVGGQKCLEEFHRQYINYLSR